MLEDALGHAELDALIGAIDPFEERQADALRELEGGRFFIARADEITFTTHLVLQSPVLKEFTTLRAPRRRVRRPHRARRAALLGPGGLQEAGTESPFPWHQDNGYTFVEPQQYLTCWVALTDATEENGCPWVVPGLHRHGTLAHEYSDIGFVCLRDPADAVAVPVRAGSIVVFSSLTPHSTGPNRTGEVRKAYIVQYAPAGAEVVRPEPGGSTTRRFRLLTRVASTRCCAAASGSPARGAPDGGCRPCLSHRRAPPWPIWGGRPIDDGRRRHGAVAVLGALHPDEVADLRARTRWTPWPRSASELALNLEGGAGRVDDGDRGLAVRLHRDVVSAQRGDLPGDRGPGHAPRGAPVARRPCSPTSWWSAAPAPVATPEAEDGGQGPSRDQRLARPGPAPAGALARPGEFGTVVSGGSLRCRGRHVVCAPVSVQPGDLPCPQRARPGVAALRGPLRAQVRIAGPARGRVAQ